MTKSLLIILSLLLCCQISFANKVDDLKTDADVLKFLTRINNKAAKRLREINVMPTDTIIKHYDCDTIPKNWHIKNWEKIDINNDGQTDLLFFSDEVPYIAIDKGKNYFEIIPLDNLRDCSITATLKYKDKHYILFHYRKFIYGSQKFSYDEGKTEPHTDTLTYKFGNIIEFNSTPANYDIDSIIFSTGACFGYCPIFSVTIDRFGNTGYTGGRWARKQGSYKGQIDPTRLVLLQNLLNYIAIKKLDNNYSVPTTDLPQCSVRIKFKDGSVKQVTDYGEFGTFGLKILYHEFFELKDSQKWTLVK